MVDIVRCEACGRTIPATPNGCAYCERERLGEPEPLWLPLQVRLFLYLFGAGLLVSFVLGITGFVLGAAGSEGPTIGGMVMAGLRAGASLLAAFAVAMRQPWQRYWPLGLLALEIAAGVAAHLGWLPPRAWPGGIFTPLWAALFVLFFLRPDIQATFDPRLRDRHEVDELIRDISRH